jgi:hypothetical protein
MHVTPTNHLESKQQNVSWKAYAMDSTGGSSSGGSGGQASNSGVKRDSKPLDKLDSESQILLLNFWNFATEA